METIRAQAFSMSDPKIVFIATPCYGGMVTKEYMQSIISLMHAGAQNNIQFILAMLGNDALITRSRNTLVSSFLNETPATHLLFIDADIGFEPEQVVALLASDKDVVGAMYPIKDYDWDQATRQTTQEETLHEAALHYVGTPVPANKAEWDGQFVTALYIGTGMLLIKRHVIERMTEAYPELQYSGIHAFPRVERKQKPQYALFECLIDRENGLYLSEDYAFCERWRRMGGKLWLNTTGKLTHTGAHRFQGNPAQRFPMRAKQVR